MTLKHRLSDDLRLALKAGDKTRVGCLRMLRARVLEREVALRPDRGVDYELEDDEVLRVLATYAKQRRESIESYRKGGREDLAEAEETELGIVEAYLPAMLSEEQIRRLVREAIAETGASSARDTGRVIKLVLSRARGAADGKVVRRIVGETLG